MPLPTIADTFRCAIEYTNTGDSRTATNVMHFLAPGKTVSDVFAALNANISAAMWAPCSTGTRVDQVVITELDGTPDGIVFGPSALTNPDWPDGAGSSDYQPQVCALIKLATAATGRSGRGRIYLPWVEDAVSTRGLIDGTTTTPCTAAWVAFSNDMIADGVALAVASYVHASASQVLNLACMTATATQRKRNKR